MTRLRKLLCALGVHFYTRPTTCGGYRCTCRRIRYGGHY